MSYMIGGCGDSGGEVGEGGGEVGRAGGGCRGIESSDEN